jgi:DNA-binding transcriptional LysR family regulator
MEFRRLRYFAAVAEDLHYTRASGRLRVAQPHLSQEIRKLEREIGVALFVRTKRSVALTPAGRVFLERTRAILAASADAVTAAQRASRGETGKLRVGFVSAAAYSAIPHAIAQFRRTHPDVELALSELNSDEGIDAVRRGQLDLCLVHPPRNIEASLNAETIWGEPLVVALPSSHALADMPRINLARLKDEAWVMWHREIASRLYDEVMGACSTAGFEPRVVQRTVRLATVVSLVGSGVGLALVPVTAAHMNINGVVFRSLTGRRTEVPMSFVWQRDAGAVLAPFMQAVRQAKLRASGLRPRA